MEWQDPNDGITKTYESAFPHGPSAREFVDICLGFPVAYVRTICLASYDQSLTWLRALTIGAGSDVWKWDIKVAPWVEGQFVPVTAAVAASTGPVVALVAAAEAGVITEPEHAPWRLCAQSWHLRSGSASAGVGGCRMQRMCHPVPDQS